MPSLRTLQGFSGKFVMQFFVVENKENTKDLDIPPTPRYPGLGYINTFLQPQSFASKPKSQNVFYLMFGKVLYLIPI